MIRLTKRFASIEKFVVDWRVGETVLKQRVNWNVKNLVHHWNFKVRMSRAPPISTSHCQQTHLSINALN